MSNERAVAAALVDWINACPIEPKISNLGELSDGFVITKVLLAIDPYYFRSTAPNSDGAGGASPGAHWVLKFHKLKRLHKDLTKYYTENLGHRLPSPPPNLTLIAKDGNVGESIKVGFRDYRLSDYCSCLTTADGI
ncbi:hypothetical protein L873DRAFT_418300 [Choiromyces venosus 120613-1]|uniref:HOOK N-terminal domain-containing protein n=1 Tax=Choiromyces venosus 120613-1 TaxID=1336337 RepID=A0A3N4K068_9PEZI|nr:hypothetical protein L873DRAFT_418300 [Choiromyces venosus 120613-1]